MLDSIRIQTLQDWECIMVDDGSTDGSDDVLREYAEKDERFKPVFVKHGENGVPLNTAWTTAEGEYLMRLDDDDLLMPHAMERLYNASEGIADAVKGTALNEKDGTVWQTNVYKTEEPFDWRQADFNTIYRHFMQPPEMWTYIYKAEIAKQIPIRTYMFSDTEYVWRTKILSKDFRYIPDPVYCWKIHPSASNSNKYPFDIVTVYDSIEKFLKENNVNLWTIFSLKQFVDYCWNLGRLEGEDRARFMEIMRRDVNRGLVMRELLSPQHQVIFDML